jgi:hypothetical protein
MQQFLEQLTRKQKIMLIGAGGALILILIVFILIASANKAKKNPVEEPTDDIPVATETEIPVETPGILVPTASPTEPEDPATPAPAPPAIVIPPESELENPTPEPTATPASSWSSTVKPITATPKPVKPAVTTAPQTQATPTPTVPAASAAPSGRFLFALPYSAYTDTVVQVAVQGTEKAKEWRIKRNGTVLSLSEAFGGTLGADGGFIAFAAEGSYELSGLSTSGEIHTANVIVLQRAAK